MKIDRRTFLGTTASAAALVTASNAAFAIQEAKATTAPSTTLLADGWKMQSSAKLDAKDGPPDPTKGDWYKVTVPCTVLAGLVANDEYPKLFFADNLTHVPKERFKASWWYHRELTVPSAKEAPQIWLYFKGINYRANIWLNGKKIAGSEKVVGTYRDFEFNITDVVDRSGPNNLFVEVFPPQKNDLAITFVDWAPAPPDQNMGLWQDVTLSTSGPLALRDPHVQTDLDVPGLKRAKLAVYVDIKNPTDKPVKGLLKATIYAANANRNQRRNASAEITLAASENRTVELSADQNPDLVINNPQVWWPSQLGEPSMYRLELEVLVDGTVSDSLSTNFGIRDIRSRLEGKSPDGKHENRLFTINGVDLLILGGGYCPDLLQRRATKERPSWQEDHIRYVRDMNLNTVRLEGKLEDDAFYDLCDRYGVLVMAGWCCCSPWEQWKNWKEEQTTVALESLRYQIRRARNHPSLVAWLNGSDNPPPANIEKQYLAIEDELKWPAPIVSSATEKSSSGPSGVKMNGPYKWVPPNFWLTDTKTGGAWGFNTEVGPGAVPPPLESLEAMLPPEDRWPINKMWDFHCGTKEFGNMNDFIKALDARYGKSQGIADFSWKAQAQAYETIRAMYEGFRANKFKATGEIQWMLNNAWPSMIWHLYDYYFRPGGAYFATKLACEPLHILYRYDNQEVVVANDSLESHSDLTAIVDVYDIDYTKRYTRQAQITAPVNTSTVAFKLPPLEGVSTTYFLRLTLTNSAKKQLSVNSYWLSKKPDVLDFSKSDWNVTPCTSFADYTDLEKLPRVAVDVVTAVPFEKAAEEGLTKATVTNNSTAIALLVRLKLMKGNSADQEVLPIRWSDNYFTLLPGERREVTARYLYTDLLWAAPKVAAECFNNSREPQK